jgi:hypothetical protein
MAKIIAEFVIKTVGAVLLGVVAQIFEHYGDHLGAIFMVCSAACLVWKEFPDDE